MIELLKNHKLKFCLLGWLLPTTCACSTQRTTNSAVVAKHTATSYITTTAQLKSDYLPDSVFHLTSTQVLIVRGSDCDYIQRDENGQEIKNCWELKAIPAAIKNLSELKELRLPLNSLAALPAELSVLHRLTLLDLTDNAGLSDIESITSLTQLRKLYLYGCYLKKLPTNIGNLQNLRILGLTGNNLSSIEQARIKKALPKCTIYF